MHAHGPCIEACAMKIAIVVLIALAWIVGLLVALPAGA
jgi:hypothetical protein